MAGFQEMMVYKKAFQMALLVFRLSKRFPPEEKYSLTDQIRRSSRSVTAQFAEAYAKKRYPLHFVSKLTDADGENSETQVWLDHAISSNYVSDQDVQEIMELSKEVGRMLGDMILHSEKYGAIDRRKA